jgi:hypothetical protein
MALRRIEVEIDELTLNGFQAVHGHRIAEGVQVELAQIVSQPGWIDVLRRALALDRLAAPSIRVAPHTRPEAIGALVARALADSIRASCQPEPARAQRAALPIHRAEPEAFTNAPPRSGKLHATSPNPLDGR